VGLAGSSAIVTATLRALSAFYGIKIRKEIVPNLVLSAETEELGIKAGLQDRVIQAYEGCMYMNFDRQLMEEKGYGKYVALDPGLLPNIYIAYKTDLSKVSGTVFNDLRERYDRGDGQTVATLQEIAALADEGKKALEERDYDTLHQLINRNFDLRRSILNIDEHNLRLVEVARECGASAKFPGSGGSIVGTYPSEEVLKKLIIEMNKLKVRVIKPFIS
jgi:glucuronokinase